ncbi:hypothetical protein [Sphingomonas abietis]|uniref:Uncharacterized protein n=1 Tax=Sphingomonas abietis TaxID=3012344 RepID=A0ABY7NJW5_9SPHN|nr:hypothetical protein [Sphingomonas abietis]WBO20887.1 hypothetical protein PBT88_11755 [Sphingomonas abietis]
MRRIATFYRDRSGLVGADFALIMLMVLAGRYVAMTHGDQIGALLGPLFSA